MKAFATLLILVFTMLVACSTSDEGSGSGNQKLGPSPESTPDLPVIFTAVPAIQTTLTGYQGGSYTSIALQDVRTNEVFSLADFEGRTVFVHPMATWCAECTYSQQRVRDGVVPVLATDDVVFVSLSVETNISDADLARYADDNDFEWRFAVATPAMLEELIDDFGRSVVSPVLSPHFVIAPNGESSPLYMGFTLPEQNIERIRARS